MNDNQKKIDELKHRIYEAKKSAKARQPILDKLTEKIALTSPQVQDFVDNLPKHISTSIYNRLDEEMLNFHKQEQPKKPINPFAIKV